MANWDVVAMAVEAARDCLTGFDHRAVASLYLAFTTHPFDDRQDASIVAGALHLRPVLRSLDAGGSLHAGTSTLATALATGAGQEGLALHAVASAPGAASI